MSRLIQLIREIRSYTVEV